MRSSGSLTWFSLLAQTSCLPTYRSRFRPSVWHTGFLQPMESFQRLAFLPSHSEDFSPLTLSEPAVLSALKRLNPMKAAGLDGVVWWRRTQASLLAQLAVQKSSFAEQRRPSSWKMVPVPKLKPVIDINKYLRPISLTSVISKLAQDPCPLVCLKEPN